MKTQKIGVVSVFLLMLVVSAISCSAQNSLEKKNTEPVQEKNTEPAQEKNVEPVQNQGEDEKIQNQTTEQNEASQGSGGDNKGKDEIENGAKQTVGESSGNGSENGQKAQNQVNQNQENQGEERRSRVANAVQEMLAVADRNPVIGQQVRTVAQNQSQEQGEMEGALQVAKKRNGVVKFLIGPNYKELKKVENRLENCKNYLKELEALRDQLGDSADAEILTQQIRSMEQIGAELENEANQEKNGMSLFGWLFKWMAK